MATNWRGVNGGLSLIETKLENIIIRNVLTLNRPFLT